MKHTPFDLKCLTCSEQTNGFTLSDLNFKSGLMLFNMIQMGKEPDAALMRFVK